jgi:hypothetical protein
MSDESHGRRFLWCADYRHVGLHKWRQLFAHTQRVL